MVTTHFTLLGYNVGLWARTAKDELLLLALRQQHQESVRRLEVFGVMCGDELQRYPV